MRMRIADVPFRRQVDAVFGIDKNIDADADVVRNVAVATVHQPDSNALRPVW